MTNDNKNLRLIDLCARLPYGVTIDVNGIRGHLRNMSVIHLYYDTDEVQDTISEIDFFGDGDTISIERIKPYLRPMSSMTEEEKVALREFGVCDDYAFHNDVYDVGTSMEDAFDTISWLLKRHFDINHLIEKGLALEAPEGMYKIKQ